MAERGLAGAGWRANQAAQSAFERRWAPVTHAMIVAEPGLYLDVQPFAGAVLRPADHFPFRAGPPWVRAGRRFAAAFRHPRLAACKRTPERLAEVLAACEGLPYILRLVAKRARVGDESAFCSELVARAFRRAGIPLLPERREAAVLPHTLDLALRADGWLDLSGSYRVWLAARPEPADPRVVAASLRTGSPAAPAPALVSAEAAACRPSVRPTRARRSARC